MYDKRQLPTKTRQYATLASDLDLVAEGAMAEPAHNLVVTTAGNVWVVEHGDGYGQQVPFPANTPQFLIGSFSEAALGIAAVLTCTGGSYPAVLAAAETIVLRLDESTIKDTGDVTVSFAAGSYTLAQIIAAINAAVATALGLSSVAVAAEDTGELEITSRAHGTAAAVEIVSVGSTLATATGLAVATENGAATGAAAGLLVQW
jgi:hypothetical protein